MKSYRAFIISLILVSAIGYVLLLSGIYYTLIVAGFIGALFSIGKLKIAILSSFFGGVIVTAAYILPLPLSYESAIFNETGSIAGISPQVLIFLMFLISTLLCIAGSLIGNFVVAMAMSSKQQIPQ